MKNIEDIEELDDTWIKEFEKLNIKIIDNVFTLNGILKTAKQIKRKFPELGLIIIDYIQLIRNPNNGNRESQISEITRELKQLASELEELKHDIQRLSLEASR
jgi:replicative DNA helicase